MKGTRVISARNSKISPISCAMIARCPRRFIERKSVYPSNIFILTGNAEWMWYYLRYSLKRNWKKAGYLEQRTLMNTYCANPL
jgi:hypothetical protein